MTQQAAWHFGVHDAHDRRYPLYQTLLLGGQLLAAETYRRGWRSVTGIDLKTYKDNGNLPPIPPRF